MADGVYIVDMAGYYYKTDGDSGRVVRAEGKDEATEFSLLDAEFMIKFRGKKDWWAIEKVNQSKVEIAEEIRPSSVDDYAWYAKVFIDALSDIHKRIAALTDELDVECGKETDLLHHIELHELDLSKKEKAYEMLEKCLRKRRQIKDELDELKEMVRARSRLQSVLQYIKRIETNRHYHPRQLAELFD